MLNRLRHGICCGSVLLATASLVGMPQQVNAVVALDEPITIHQDDGTSFTGYIYGDEAQGWIETADGYTIVRVDCGPTVNGSQLAETPPCLPHWEYATGTSGGTIHLSGIIARPGLAPPSNIPKHLRPARQDDHDDKIGSEIPINEPPRGPKLAGLHLTDWNPTPVSGSRKLLIILVGFQDEALTTTANDWNDAVFSTTPGVKSVANFYKDNSFGTMSVSPTSHTQAGNPPGIVTVSIALDHPNYGNNYTKATEAPWLNAALEAAKSFVDFQAMDANNDGNITTDESVIYFIPAGYDASSSSKTPNVWAHAWSGNEVTADGKTVLRWAMNGELSDSSDRHPMGVIAHELGHQMCGLPDLYDPDYKNNGLGGYSVMSFGSWGKADSDAAGGDTPVNMDAWCREYLGWSSPRVPGSSGPVTFGTPLDSTTAPLKLINTSESTREYFLVENRYPKGWDMGLEKYLGTNWGGGLLIEHIDNLIGSPANNDINLWVSGQHQGVVAVEATTNNGSIISVPPANQGTIDDIFFDPQNANFLDSTTPNSKLYNGTATDVGLCGISGKAENMSATFVDCSTAKVTACVFDDHNANGVRDPGDEGIFTNWQFDWKSGGKSGVGTITTGRCADLYDDLPPCPANIVLKVSAVDEKFIDPTGNGKRWQFTTAREFTVDTNCTSTTTVEFGVVELGTVTVHKFDDGSMDGVQAGGEGNLKDWPFRLTGNAIDNSALNLTGATDSNGDYIFKDLLPSDATGYTVREDLTWETVQPCTTNPYSVSRANHDGKRWQATTAIEQTATLSEGADLTQIYGNVCLGAITACVFKDLNMSGSREAAETYSDFNGNGKWDPSELFGDVNNNGIWDAAELYTDTNNNGYYDSGEPFVDTNGNSCWDPGEPLRDENGNGVWDPAEPFTDTFANGTWDAAEDLQPDWPVAVCGTDAIGRCIGPIKAVTDSGGCIELKDLPPGSYKVYQDSTWCDGPISWCSGGVQPPVDRRKTTFNGRRWLATTDIMSSFDFAECAVLPNFQFGNVCLAAITGALTLKSCPDDPALPLSGWEVCMKLARVEQTNTFTTLPLLATDPDCMNLVGNCTVSKQDGSYRFGELVPGIYQIGETSQPGYVPIGNLLDRCVPVRISCEDHEIDLSVRDVNAVCPLYQAYPGESPDQKAFHGYNGIGGDIIDAVPGVFSLEPGGKWGNYVRATAGCELYCLKNIVFQKEHFALRQCGDIFPSLTFSQHGTQNIRTWWPLMYEPPGTLFTLSLLYGTNTAVQLPGETIPSVVHSDKWRWRVEVTLDSLDDLLDVFHSMPFGLDEVPLISSDYSFGVIKSYVEMARNAQSSQELAGMLTELELAVSDQAISVSPPYPIPEGPGLGIANTRENPAACKILLDLEWLLIKNGLQ